jgi:hypothetical protein
MKTRLNHEDDRLLDYLDPHLNLRHHGRRSYRAEWTTRPSQLAVQSEGFCGFDAFTKCIPRPAPHPR